jgi:DNA ligase-1
MRDFARLFAAIDETNKTTEKVAAMERFFRLATPADAAWAMSFLTGRRPKRLVISTKLHQWASEMAGVPEWLFYECYDAVGDLAETIAAILPDADPEAECSPGVQAIAARGSGAEPESLEYWVRERLLPLGGMTDEEQKASLFESWSQLNRSERLVFNKLITGAWRVGVSQDLVVRALGQASGVAAPVLAHRLMGDWSPSAEFFDWLTGPETGDSDVSRPYPFCLAHPLEGEPSSLGAIKDWQIEWKFDGIRAQLIRRRGESFIWSRGEDLITERFPEIREVCDALPEGTVLDGEILAWSHGKPMPFLNLQKRIGRKLLGKKILTDVPVAVVVFDVMEKEGLDLREAPTSERRAALEVLVSELNARPVQSVLDLTLPPGVLAVDARLASRSAKEEISWESRLLVAQSVVATDWDDLARQRRVARELNVEGVMIKRRDSPYMVGRKKGYWWKWKIDPLTVDAVLIYAQRGSGKRASLYSDYTFGVWHEGKLIPFAKAYSGLTDEELRKVDSWVRRNSTEKFGPVRVVKPELVMELAFEQIQLSNRHKAGIAVRFPRIARWRHDKKADEADTLDGVKSLLDEKPQTK